MSSSDKENANSANPKGKPKGRIAPASKSSQRTAQSSRYQLQDQHDDMVDGDGEEGDKQFYDPDQALEQKRAVRRGFRDLGKTVNESKQEFLQSTSNGALTAFENANTLFKNVKQTSDATLDSRILVNLGELIENKAKLMDFGKSTGIDIDDFISRLRAYMANSPDSEGIDHEESGEAYDWAYLGRVVAFKGNKRPATSDFLLGPLSVTKRQRVFTQRPKKSTQTVAEVRPQELSEKEIDKQENSTTKMVMTLHNRLEQYLAENDLLETGENYFRFIINPDSFGQTVENAFYVSFLVRDGRIALFEGEDGLPTLNIASAPTEEEARQSGLTKKQIIAPLDKWTWKKCINVFDITESIIPTREIQPQNVGATGWYA